MQSKANPSNPRFWKLFTAVACVGLPVVNTGVFFAIRRLGGSHGQAWPHIALAGLAEFAVLLWFCWSYANRRTLLGAFLGMLVNTVVTALLIALTTLIVLAAGYSGGGGGT